jgi:hypothetical protein
LRVLEGRGNWEEGLRFASSDSPRKKGLEEVDDKNLLIKNKNILPFKKLEN